jgi:hypothetical protein
MRERGRPVGDSLGAVLEAEAFAGVTTALCLAALAGLTWVAQQDPAGMPGVARTLIADVIEVLRWGLVVGLGLRGLGGLVQAGLTPACGRFPGEAYGALGAGPIWLAGSVLASASRTPEAALWSTFVLAVLALGTCGLSVPVLWWMAGHHGDHLAARRLRARRAAARERAHQWHGPAVEDG